MSKKSGRVYQLINALHQYIIDNNTLFAEMDKLNKGVTDEVRVKILGYDEFQEKHREYNPDGPSEVEAFYNVNTKHIYLHDQIDFSTFEGRSIVLHEYVHFLQSVYGLDQSVLVCAKELEKDAYELEIKYLIDNGEPKDSEKIKLLGFLKLINSDCGPPWR